MVDVGFALKGDVIPSDNAYLLFSAISRKIGKHPSDDIAISSLGGGFVRDGLIRIRPVTKLWLRTSLERASEIRELLEGTKIDLAGHSLTIGASIVRPLRPASDLTARIVVIKGYQRPIDFLDRAKKALAGFGIVGNVEIPAIRDGPHVGKPSRRIVDIKGYKVVGFEVRVSGLNDVESIRLQRLGIGGRRHMGCGIFVPTVGSESRTLETRKGGVA